mmetsp:Transcript_24384/g.46056  ORF Transcript_24384/g.46056 Transcript_24384/m.46056 type:complete len:145 (-) Transcript_24384:5396-5830(-)
MVKLTSGPSLFSARVTSRISLLVWRSGKSTNMRRGNRLKTASSRSNGRFVDPMTTTLSEPASPFPLVPEFKPSHSLIIVYGNQKQLVKRRTRGPKARYKRLKLFTHRFHACQSTMRRIIGASLPTRKKRVDFIYENNTRRNPPG